MTPPSSSGYRKRSFRGKQAWTLIAFLLGCGMVWAQSAAGRPGPGKVVKVAAAADLQPVMPALAAAFEKQTGVKLQVSFGSSSALATQIVNGAPFDVFLSADYVFPEQVVAVGLTDQKAAEPYARGTLVLYARKDLPAPLSMNLLEDPRITKIAVADELHAPYGRSAYAALRWMKLYDKVRGKLVVAENVSQTAQFVQTGNAQVGFISLTLASSPAFKVDGQFARVPDFAYPEMRQCMIVMKNSPELAEAKAFAAFMLSHDVQMHLRDFGLEPVR